MVKRVMLISVALALLTVALAGCGGSAATPTQPAGSPPPAVAAVKVNAHPASLEGKTVLLRWNSKPNGDKLLNNIADLMTQKVPGVKIIKSYETDPSTVEISKDNEESAKLADKIAALKPDLVIASQAD